MAGVPRHKILTIRDVKDLGRALIYTANLYPTKFLTERDFFPLVVTYLTGRVPDIRPEIATMEGVIDFHLVGNNPTWLELAVQPRELIDKNAADVVFPGHRSKNSLYASQNATVVRKLMLEPAGKTRFLLLLDLHGTYSVEKLKRSYCTMAEKINKRRAVHRGKSINVVYSSVNKGKDEHFRIGA